MELSPLGEIVKTEIERIPSYHPCIILDEWVIMPNHIHLIIELRDDGFDNGIVSKLKGGNGDNGNNVNRDVMVEKIHEFSLPSSPQQQWWHNLNYKPTDNEIKQYRKFRRRMIIPKIMGKLKMKTSKQINILQNTPGRKNWQKDYHDHIVRNQKLFHNIKTISEIILLIGRRINLDLENRNPYLHSFFHIASLCTGLSLILQFFKRRTSVFKTSF